MMRKDIKDRWVAALRSGKYGQTMGKLSDGQGNYCCLGVLCELAIEDGVEIEKAVRLSGRILYDNSDSLPPQAVRAYAGMGEDPGWILPTGNGGEFHHLPALNDYGSTFAEIADLIEKHEVS